jgi:hypothetical protein
VCEPDGYFCSVGQQCCSGVCFNGSCGYPFDSGPTCLPDGYGCSTWQQCCSGNCFGGVCGGIVVDSGPSCFPDGFGCQSWQDCCSGDCNLGVCGGVFDAGPPPDSGFGCVPTGSNQCDGCLAALCCSQLSACEMDPTCMQAQKCFDGCYVPGQGAACEQKCAQAFPSPAGQNLLTCAANSCIGSCQ